MQNRVVTPRQCRCPRYAEAKYLIKINASNEALTNLDSLIKNGLTKRNFVYCRLTSIDLKSTKKSGKYLVELRNSAEYQNEAITILR